MFLTSFPASTKEGDRSKGLHDLASRDASSLKPGREPYSNSMGRRSPLEYDRNRILKNSNKNNDSKGAPLSRTLRPVHQIMNKVHFVARHYNVTHVHSRNPLSRFPVVQHFSSSYISRQHQLVSYYSILVRTMVLTSLTRA